MGGWSQSNAWGTYPTVTMDKDLDVAWTWETFGPNYDPYPNWNVAKGFAPPGASYVAPPYLGYGVQSSGFSGGAFMGQTSCAGTNPQPRWGDYVLTIWDANYSSPSGEKGSFWTVQEYTTGGSNQSTNWQALAGPLPFFVSSSFAESECGGGIGSTCKVTLAPPSGLQSGDVLLVSLDMAQLSSKLPVLPSGWTLLPQANPLQITSEDHCGFAFTSWLAAHVYGASGAEPSSYSFTHYDAGDHDSCNGVAYGSEMDAFAVAYRGASTNLGGYAPYGFTQNADLSTFSTAAITPPGESQLLTIFSGPGPESESTETSAITFTAPAGSPALSVETSLSNTPGYLAADVPVPPGNTQSFGGYSTSVNTACSGKPDCLWYGWELAIPE